MSQESDKIRLFQRIKQVASWVCFDPSLREDVAQEAWLKCLEYAEANHRPIENLSNTEIKHRCYEAMRKLSPKEYPLTEDLEDSIADFENPSPFERLVKTEETHISSKRVQKIEWLLKAHPKLLLSPMQWNIYEELKQVTPRTANVWRARYARSLKVTRQNIWNIERKVRQKIIFAQDLSELFNGNIIGFFEKYSQKLYAPEQKILLRPIIMKGDQQIQSNLRLSLTNLQDEMLEIAAKILTGNGFKTRQIALACQLLREASWIDFQKVALRLRALQSEIPNENWLAHNFIFGLLRYVSEDWLGKYVEKKKYLAQKDIPESKWFTSYLASRHGCVDEQASESYLEHQGKIAVVPHEIDRAIKEIYEHTLENYYLKNPPAQIDVDILSLLLLLKRSHGKPKLERSKNTLKTLIQIGCNSADSYISQESKKLAFQY